VGFLYIMKKSIFKLWRNYLYPDSLLDSMAKPNDPIKNVPSEDTGDLVEDSMLQEFQEYVQEARNFFKNVNPYTPDPLKPYMDKADQFLIRHTGRSYQDLLRNIDATPFESADFELLPKQGLKKMLFDYRARVYLAALDSYERAHPEDDLGVLLKKIQGARIPPIKKEADEPVYNALLELLI
jgi:hypothetical protein